MLFLDKFKGLFPYALSFLTWNPDRNFFIIPYINHPVTWYGFLFASGFLIGYFLIRKIFFDLLTDWYEVASRESLTIKSESIHLADKLAFFVILGGVIGARLGHVFFYGWSFYQHHLLNIFKVWEGGLASHGGAIGIFLALILFVFSTKKKYPILHFLAVLDIVVIPTPLAGCLIRIGNFINQEITGIVTEKPWGVIFQYPMDGVPGVPVHPVQLYESFAYLCIFILLITLWYRNKKTIGSGLLSGLFFLLVFSARFILEFFKIAQTQSDTVNFLSRGQLLSIPFMLFGLWLLVRNYFFVRKNE